ncbi:MAG: O-antigen ligase family protein [Elusimicrobia bacterium]|nr:O-antigen ligase family protein [Elusimicrobiota bacterium]
MKRPSTTALASLAAAAAVLAASAWHIARNAAPPAWDDAWYLEVSFRLWSALKSSPLAFARAYADAFHIKAPLIALAPFPLYALFGTGERVAVWANLPLAALGAWAWSRAAAAWWRGHPRGADAAALGGALVALLPVSYGLSRLFFTETLVAALLGLFAWRCAVTEESERSEGVRLGVLLGLGALAKVTFPLVAAGFVWGARERLRPHARTALIVAAAVAGTWYLWNAPYVLGYAWSAGFGKVARDYAGAGGLGARLDWALAVVRHDLSWPMTAAAAAVSALALVRRRRADHGVRSALWGLAPLSVYAVGVNTDARLPAPLLPVAALLAARAAVSFERSAARAAAAALLLGAGLGVCADQTFLAAGDRALAYNGAPSADSGWDRGALVDASAAAAGRDGVAAVALEHRFLNANNLSSLAASRGLRLGFVSLGYAQDSAEAALIRLKDKDARALIFVDGLPAADLPAFLNRANAGVAAAAASGRLGAVESARVRSWRSEPALIALIVYGAAGLLAAAWSGAGLPAFRDALKDWHRLWSLGLFVAAFTLEPDAPVRQALGLAFAVEAAIGIGQVAYHGAPYGVLTRAQAFVHPVVFGEQMALAVLGGACLLLRPTRGTTRGPASAFTALTVVALALSQTRMAVLAAVAAFCAVCLIEPRARRWALAACGAGATAAVMWEFLPTGGHTLSSLLRYDPANPQQIRYVLWDAAWRMFLDHPATGVGPGGYLREFARYVRPSGAMDNEAVWGSAHNLYLHQLAERGVAGGAALAALSTVLLTRAVSAARGGAFARSLLAASAVVMFLLMSLTETTIQNEQFSTLLLFIWAWGTMELRRRP